MRIILCLLCCFSLLCAKTSINEQTKNLKENERIQRQLNKKLEDLAVDILNSEKKLKKLANDIEKLSDETKKLEKNAKIQSQELSTLNAQNEDLVKNRNIMENKLVDLIAKDFVYDLPIPKGYLESEESFMAFEVLKNLDAILTNELYQLSKDYESINKTINEKQSQIRTINISLKEYNKRLEKLQELKQNQENEIKKQKTDKEIYTKKLSTLKDQQDELRKTLAELKIIEEKKLKAQNKEKEEIKNADSEEIRRLGNGYQGGAVKKYSGAKTIAPLDSFIVKQKFGNYTDPVYKIKIFNENVVLKSKTPDAVVKSILNGKIVFAKDTNMLQKVVIVEHSNGIHTIYAHLDKIAPTIQVGKNVKKGAVLGRVKDELTFEVTQKNFHINPLELISLN
ncbi:murein hydrolase activator EnvC [Campylobacter sp. US33a]|uniref:murein hydrolase activator EnvC family protein n=1 Tax=Campylobacter sp. US33a TaxID=2498120 RepID=UPI0010688630|nr:peptidoglycan DD-metalloendopeptidase family protein [Campylobacter sp. US33a]TEY03593.1 peptidase M23 [Campylobacter sp. US33a]